MAFIGHQRARQRIGPHACQATTVVEARVEAWRVHDTGLVAVPSRFRRLGGLVRHLQGHGDALAGRASRSRSATASCASTGPTGAVGALAAAEVARHASWPPARRCSFVLEVPGAAHLLAAAAGAATDALLRLPSAVTRRRPRVTARHVERHEGD